MFRHRRMFAFWALILPGIAWADTSGTQTVNSGQDFSFDSGTTSSSGGDIQYTGTNIAFQGSATGISGSSISPLLTGPTVYGTIMQQDLSAFASSFGSVPLSGSSIAANAIFAVHTNKGNYAKALITAVSSSSITFQYTTFGATTGGGGGPTITQILNNYGLVPAGFSNSGIAQGSLFIIKGSGLADPNAQAMLPDLSKNPTLPTILNGASVKIVDSSSATITPVFYYAIAGQLALVLPSNTATGTAQVTVTYNNQTSTAFAIKVVKSAMGFDAYYGIGSGLGVATDNSKPILYNYGNSIPPGTTVVLWGSGLGADPARDNTYTPAAFIIQGLDHVYVGGVDAPIVYQGASGYPGLNQVDITIPTNAPTGCNVSLVGVTAAGVPTNFLTLPIGTGACSDPAFGISGSQLQQLSLQNTVKSGFVGLYHSVSPATSGSGTQTNDVAFASFQSQPGSSYGAAGGSVSIPGCIVSQTSSGGGTSNSTGLDAGNIAVNGPAGNATLTSIPQVLGSYFAKLASGFIPTAGGNFSFQGNGGKDVGSFNASVVFPNPLLNWTNQSAAATVNLASGLQFTWSAGAPGSLVFMQGNSSGTSASASFLCIAPVETQQFSVPSYVTAALPPGSGNASLANYTDYKTFSASGLDFGASAGYVSYSVNATWQ